MSGKVNVDNGLDNIRWIRGLRGERLPAACHVLLPNLEKRLFFAVGAGPKITRSVFYTPPAEWDCIRRPAGARKITGRRVNTVTRGWAGARNERAQFRLHGAVVGFVDRCLSWTRNLAANISCRRVFLRPILPQLPVRNVFFRLFSSFDLFQ